MTFDDSLLTSPNPITLDDLKTYFRKNDFTSSVNPSEPISVHPNRERIYPKIRSCFVEAWNRSLKKLGIGLCGKSSGRVERRRTLSPCRPHGGSAA